jgi:hypothetical protein
MPRDRQEYLAQIAFRYSRRKTKPLPEVHRSGLSCPRCGGRLKEHEPNQFFARWWECMDCWGGFEMRCGVLQFGRTVRDLDFC